MPASVQTILKQRFGFPSLHPIQKRIIDRVMQRHGNALVVMPTGSGKSLCYQLPALALPQPGITLVFSPLIALMEDQVSALKARDIKAEYINSTLSRRERDRRAKRMAEGQYELIYATPERMQKPEFVEALNAVPGGVKLLAVDEAHCISRWGHDLRPAYRLIGRFRKKLNFPTTIALTATATKSVRNDVRRTLGLDERRMPLFATPVDRPNLSFEVVHLWHEDDKVEHIQQIVGPDEAGDEPSGTGIVYFARIKDLDSMASRMRKLLDRPIEIYHGQLAPRSKKRVYDRFIKATPDEGLLLFATNAFGMGVDKADIRFIIHAQMPGSVESYYQEVGRAGRDGEPSRCVMLYTTDDLAIQQQFVEWENPPPSLLMRAARAVEACPHADFDQDELHVLVSGKARGDWRAQVEATMTALERRGVIEPTSIMGRYRFVRELAHADVDPAAIERKKQRDLRRLLDVVKLAKCRDIRKFVNKYFELSDDSGAGTRRTKKKKKRRGSRRGGGGQGQGQGQGQPAARGKGPAERQAGNDDERTPPRRKGRRRGRRGGRNRSSATGSPEAKAPPPDGASATTKKKKTRRRRRKPRPGGAAGGD